jgi:hypothetical protein
MWKINTNTNTSTVMFPIVGLFGETGEEGKEKRKTE